MEIDTEKQPLLGRAELRYRRYRPLTYEEVLSNRQEVTWRRARFWLVFMFWAVMAMLLSLLACLLIGAPDCRPYRIELQPSVPPVHLTFAPLVGRFNGKVDDQRVF